MYESYVRGFLALFSLFVKKKVTIDEKVSFRELMYWGWLHDCSKTAKNKRNDNDIIDCQQDVTDIFTAVVFLIS